MSLAAVPYETVISIGTNTARLLLARESNEGRLEVAAERQTGTRLGQGLSDAGLLQEAAMQRTLDAVGEFVRVAAGFGASAPFCIATSAARRAQNIAEFRSRMQDVTGVPLQVLDGRTEARASFLGATYGAAPSGARTAVVDVGGGSTECAVGRDGVLEAARSIEIGSVRLGERYEALLGGARPAAARAAAQEARQNVARALAPFAELPPVAQVRCVAGTSLTLAAVALGSDVGRVSGLELSVATLDATIDLLLGATLAERRALAGMLPQRADILPAGGLVLSEALRLLGSKTALLEANDLLLGFLLLQREDDGATE